MSYVASRFRVLSSSIFKLSRTDNSLMIARRHILQPNKELLQVQRQTYSSSFCKCYRHNFASPDLSKLDRLGLYKNIRQCMPNASYRTVKYKYLVIKGLIFLRQYVNRFATYLMPVSLSFSLFSTNDKKDEDSVTYMIKLAVLAIQKEELPKAEQLLHVALKSAQETNDENAITYIYDLMANLALQRNELDKAENLFVEVLKRFLNRGLEVDDNAVVEVSLKLSSIYANLGQPEKAVEGFKFCIGTQESKINSLGEDNVDEDTLVLWAMSQDWYARFLLNIGKYSLAKQHFLRAFDVCVKVMGPEDPQVAVLLNDLGSVSSLLKDYDEAVDYLQRAIEVGKKSNNEDLCSFYVNLGTVYMQKGLSQEAERFCSEGLKLAKKFKNSEAVNESTVCLEGVQGLQSA